MDRLKIVTHPLAEYSDRPDQIGHLIRSFTQMEQAIQARLNELSTLLNTSAAVVSSLDSHTVLSRILEQVEQLLNIRICAIVALDKMQNVFRIQASRGLSKQYVERFTVDPDELPADVLDTLRNGKPVQIGDTGRDPAFAAWIKGLASLRNIANTFLKVFIGWKVAWFAMPPALGWGWLFAKGLSMLTAEQSGRNHRRVVRILPFHCLFKTMAKNRQES